MVIADTGGVGGLFGSIIGQNRWCITTFATIAAIVWATNNVIQHQIGHAAEESDSESDEEEEDAVNNDGLAEEDESSKAANVFLAHGSIQYFPTDELLTIFGCVSHEFKDYARREFNDRLVKCHPSLVDAVGGGSENIDSISWKDWCRFELGEDKSMHMGEHISISRGESLRDFDVLLEVKMSEQIILHGCSPLRFEGGEVECEFRLPHFSIDAPMPDDHDEFSYPDPYFPGAICYRYWCGRDDVSVQQKSLCKALYGINSPEMLKVHVVLRSRQTGKMVTVLSTSEPNQIIGEDYGDDVGNYAPCYDNRCILFQEDNRLGCEIGFDLYCATDDVDTAQNSIQFGTRTIYEDEKDSEDNEESDQESDENADEDDEDDDGDTSESEDDYFTLTFRFFICDKEEWEVVESLVLQAMSSWKWG